MTSVTFPPSLGGDGSTVSDDSNPATGLGNGGHRTRFVPAMGQTLACMNGAIAQATAQVALAADQVALATTEADDAANSASQAAVSAASALSAPGTSATSTTSLTIGTGSKSLTLAQTGKSFAPNQFVELVNSTGNWMLGNVLTFVSGTGAMTVDVTHIGGSGTFAAWTITPAVPSQLPSPAGNAGKAILANSAGNGYVFGAVDDVPRVARAANTQLVKADKGTWFNATANFTQTFDTANLGANWNCWYSTAPGVEVTIPSSDGVSNWIMYGGETRFFQWDGTTLRSYVIQPFLKVFTTSGNFIKPPGYQRFGTRLWGGGNSGRRSSAGIAAQGGGGGGCTGDWVFPESAFSASTVVTIAAGGAPQTIANTAGNPGGTTSLGTLLSISNSGTDFSIGGSLVDMSATVPVGWEAGSSSASASNKRPLLGGGSSIASSTDQGRNSMMGGAAGGFIDSSSNVHSPGTSANGGNGGAASVASNGTAGTAPAGGGGGTQTGTQSGAGARGEAHLWGVV